MAVTILSVDKHLCFLFQHTSITMCADHGLRLRDFVAYIVTLYVW
jgi:hypothetical protein